MKTLSEELNEVMASKMSKQAKKEAIIKLGIREKEANFLLKMKGVVSARCKFNATTLTFGVEIECYNVERQRLITEVESKNINIQSQSYNHRDSNSLYKIVSDASIYGVNAQEVVSPILRGKNGLESLKKVCESLNNVGAKVNISTGLHIHFDASKISDIHYCRIFTNYAKLEKVIDSFMPFSRRGNNNNYCRSISHFINRLSNYSTKEQVIAFLNSRYHKVNAQAYRSHKTIEFRQHSGTTDFEKISNWINFLRKLIQFSYEKDIQECNTIEQIPFLTETEKQYFINRKNSLD